MGLLDWIFKEDIEPARSRYRNRFGDDDEDKDENYILYRIKKKSEWEKDRYNPSTDDIDISDLPDFD